MIGLDQVWGMTLLLLTLYGFQLSAWNLGVTTENGLAQTSFGCITELEILNDRLGPGPREYDSHYECEEIIL